MVMIPLPPPDPFTCWYQHIISCEIAHLLSLIVYILLLLVHVTDPRMMLGVMLGVTLGMMLGVILGMMLGVMFGVMFDQSVWVVTPHWT